jgi:hypothetical protein
MAKSSEDPQVVTTKDRWAILVLIARDHVANKIEPVVVGTGAQITLYEFPDTAHTDFEAWMRGDRTEPFGSFRKLKEAEELFKDNMHRYSRS